MIVRNEEEFLPECLESIKDFADEIVVVDTGSTDRTISIAESYGAKIGHFEWNDSFSDARNKSLDLATSDWVFIMDADERILNESKHTIKHVLQQETIGGNVDIFSIYQNSRLKDGQSDFYKSSTIRLWRNTPEIRYKGRVHESVQHALESGLFNGATIDASIEHKGYLSEVVQQRHKEDRNSKLMQIELDENPDSLHYLFHMGRQYQADGKPEEAIAAFEKALGLVSPDVRFIEVQICSSLATLYGMNDDVDKALEIIDRVESYDIKHPEIIYTKGRMMIMLHNYTEALNCFHKAKEAASSMPVNWGDLSVGEYKADWGISAALAALERFDEAAMVARQTLDKAPDHYPTRLILLAAYQALEQWDNLRDCLLEVPCSDLRYDQFARHLISVYESQGKVSDIKKIGLYLLESDCDPANTHFILGVCAEEENDALLAEKYYKRAIELEPNYVEAYNNLGLLYVENGCVSDGLDVLSDCIQNCPDYPHTYFNMGDVLYKIEQYSVAANTYQAGLLRCPDHAPGYFTLGNCYYQMSAFDAATMAYKQAITLNPNYQEAKNNLTLIEKAA